MLKSFLVLKDDERNSWGNFLLCSLQSIKPTVVNYWGEIVRVLLNGKISPQEYQFKIHTQSHYLNNSLIEPNTSHARRRISKVSHWEIAMRNILKGRDPPRHVAMYKTQLLRLTFNQFSMLYQWTIIPVSNNTSAPEWHTIHTISFPFPPSLPLHLLKSQHDKRDSVLIFFSIPSLPHIFLPFEWSDFKWSTVSWRISAFSNFADPCFS